MQANASLEMHRADKLDIRKKNFYDNSKKTALLIEAGSVAPKCL